MNIPRTPLSMTYHSALPRYRDEMHHDFEQAYQRFGIDAALARLAAGARGMAPPPRVPNGAEIRAAIEDIDFAAYQRRHDEIDKLKGPFDKFFVDLMPPILIAETENPLGAPPQPDPVGNLAAALVTDIRSLSLVYHLFYSPDFRQRADGKALFGVNYANGGLGAAWDAVRDELDSKAPNGNRVEKQIRTLCRWLSDEFYAYVWPFPW